MNQGRVTDFALDFVVWLASSEEQEVSLFSCSTHCPGQTHKVLALGYSGISD